MRMRGSGKASKNVPKAQVIKLVFTDHAIALRVPP